MEPTNLKNLEFIGQLKSSLHCPPAKCPTCDHAMAESLSTKLYDLFDDYGPVEVLERIAWLLTEQSQLSHPPELAELWACLEQQARNASRLAVAIASRSKNGDCWR